MRRIPALVLRRLRKIASLSGAEWRDLMVAQVALLRAQWRVWRAPTGTLVVAREPAGEAAAAPGDRDRAYAIALAISRAAEHGLFRPFCLVRALALQSLLTASGIRGSDVRVGVRRENGAFAAHAWIVWRGDVLGDRPDHVAQFVEVEDLRVLTKR
jgi:hypothetical protein